MATLYHDLTLTVASTLGLAHLEAHAPLIGFAFVLWVGLQLVSPLLWSRLLPNHYPKLSYKTRRAWDVRFVAFAHALYSAPASWYLLWHRERQPALVAQPLIAYDHLIATVGAVSTGYFLWDALVSIFNIGGSGGLGFVIHGVGCFTAFLNAQRPFALYFLPVFLFWETSSIFLNIHWALDKVGRTGSRLQLVNGVILIASFFFVRIVVGYYSSYQFFLACQKAAVKISTPAWVLYGYQIANIVLNGLNTYWLTQMIKSVKKRFDPPAKSSTAQQKQKKRS